MDSPLKGKRCIAFARFARLDGYGEEVGKQQLREMGQFAEKHEMILVSPEVAAAARSRGFSTPVELQSLLERAQIAQDYEVLLITEPTRLSRDHMRFAAMEHAFETAGVAVVMTRYWPSS